MMIYYWNNRVCPQKECTIYTVKIEPLFKGTFNDLPQTNFIWLFFIWAKAILHFSRNFSLNLKMNFNLLKKMKWHLLSWNVSQDPYFLQCLYNVRRTAEIILLRINYSIILYYFSSFPSFYNFFGEKATLFLFFKLYYLALYSSKRNSRIELE